MGFSFFTAFVVEFPDLRLYERVKFAMLQGTGQISSNLLEIWPVPCSIVSGTCPWRWRLASGRRADKKDAGPPATNRGPYRNSIHWHVLMPHGRSHEDRID